jgi:hypothetical protein
MGRFTSRTIKIQNAAVRFSGIYALRAESGSLIFDGRLSSTPPSSGDFNRAFRRIVGRSPTQFANRFRSCDAR